MRRSEQHNGFLSTQRTPTNASGRPRPNPTSLSRYLYVSDDPVNLVDPSGRDAFECILGVIVGWITGFLAFVLDQEEQVRLDQLLHLSPEVQTVYAFLQAFLIIPKFAVCKLKEPAPITSPIQPLPYTPPASSARSVRPSRDTLR